MYSLRFGEYGLLDVQAKFFEIPHFFSDHVASTPYDENGGDFTLGWKPTSRSKPTSYSGWRPTTNRST